MFLPSQKSVPKIIAIVVMLIIAPPVGLWVARDTNLTTNMSATNKMVGLASAAPSAASARVVHNDFAGVLLPPQMANLAPRADGRVESVPVKVGQRVRVGDVILRFDPRQRKHELAVAQAALHGAQASAGAASSEMQAARRRAARRNATVEVNGQAIAIVSGEEAAQAQSDARTASARTASAGASIAEAQAHVEASSLALEETEIRAPFDGVVTAILYEPGMSVHAGDSVARVVGGSGLRVRFAVQEEDVEILRDRRRARIMLENTLLFATVDQVAPEVEPASRAFIVEGPVDGGDAACGATGCAMVAGRGLRVSFDIAATSVAAAPMPTPAIPAAAAIATIATTATTASVAIPAPAPAPRGSRKIALK